MCVSCKCKCKTGGLTSIPYMQGTSLMRTYIHGYYSTVHENCFLYNTYIHHLALAMLLLLSTMTLALGKSDCRLLQYNSKSESCQNGHAYITRYVLEV
jgi:hypothetical protein